MSEELIKLVTDKICFVSKEQLNRFAFERKIIGIKDMNKYGTIDLIHKKLDASLATELVSLFNDLIGYTAVELEERLKISKSERLKWTKQGLLNVTGYYDTRAYGKTLACPIYDAHQTWEISQDKISEWRSSIKPLTDKQKVGLEKAKETALKNRTCRICGYEESHKNNLEDGCCEHCISKLSAYERRKYWLANKNNYVILDTETTGLDGKDQIIEIGIIDLDGNILFESLVMPTVPISEEAYHVHGICEKYLLKQGARGWDKIYLIVKEVLKDKIILAYNADFDKDMLRQTCRDYGVELGEISFECLMQNAMIEFNTDRFISLRHAAGEEYQNHRAIGDCQLCLELIKNNTIEKVK